jgi:hypothetical protein
VQTLLGVTHHRALGSAPDLLVRGTAGRPGSGVGTHTATATACWTPSSRPGPVVTTTYRILVDACRARPVPARTVLCLAAHGALPRLLR